MDIDEIIIKTFSENQNICFPVYCQRDAKSFIKILFKNGLNGVIFSQEIGESETNFTSWKNGLSKLGVGKKVMKRINRPIEDFLWSGGELSDLEKEVKAEVNKIKSSTHKKTNISRRIELGRSPTTKAVSEKVTKKERRTKDKVVIRCSFDDSKISLKSVSSSAKSPENDIPNAQIEERYLPLRNFQRGISCPEKENNQEFMEDFKTIKLRKTGRIDLFESDAATNNLKSGTEINNRPLAIQELKQENNFSKENAANSTNENISSSIDPLIISGNSFAKDKHDTDNFGEENSKESQKCSKVDSDILEAAIYNIASSSYSETNSTAEVSQEIENGKNGEISEQEKSVDSSVDYLYVFTDSNSCNSSPVKPHRFKIGVASCPYEELKKASEFNIDIKLISATAVKNPQQVMERIQGELQVFLMKGRESWYYCPLTKVLQTTSDAISWSSNYSRYL